MKLGLSRTLALVSLAGFTTFAVTPVHARDHRERAVLRSTRLGPDAAGEHTVPCPLQHEQRGSTRPGDRTRLAAGSRGKTGKRRECLEGVVRATDVRSRIPAVGRGGDFRWPKRFRASQYRSTQDRGCSRSSRRAHRS